MGSSMLQVRGERAVAELKRCVFRYYCCTLSISYYISFSLWSKLNCCKFDQVYKKSSSIFNTKQQKYKNIFVCGFNESNSILWMSVYLSRNLVKLLIVWLSLKSKWFIIWNGECTFICSVSSQTQTYHHSNLIYTNFKKGASVYLVLADWAWSFRICDGSLWHSRSIW